MTFIYFLLNMETVTANTITEEYSILNYGVTLKKCKTHVKNNKKCDDESPQIFLLDLQRQFM